MMRLRHFTACVAAAALLGACKQQAPSEPGGIKVPEIKVRSAEQEKLHQLKAFDLAIALKRAIYDAGYRCQRLTDGGFVATYKNLDMWMAKCSEGRNWAVFAGPDGSAQVRDCKDVEATGLPKCVVSKKPEGSFTDLRNGRPATRAAPAG